jgi:hypothetical protein
MSCFKLKADQSAFPSKATRKTWLFVLALFVTAFFFFLFNLRFLSPVTFFTDNVIFGADTQEVLAYMRSLSFEGDMQKHLLFSATTYPFVYAFEKFPFVSERRAILLVLSLLAAMNTLGAFLLLRNYFFSVKLALLFTLLYLFSFSALIIMSIPETYAVSNLTILLYLLALFRFRDSLDMQRSLILSLIAGFAALYNLPLLSLIIIHLLMMLRHPKRWIPLAVGNIAMGACVFLLANFLRQSYVTSFFSRFLVRLIHSLPN